MAFKEDSCGKFKPNYESAYLVMRVLSGGALCFSEIDKGPSPEPINLDSLRKFSI